MKKDFITQDGRNEDQDKFLLFYGGSFCFALESMLLLQA